MNPARGKLFVEPIDTAETLPGGKILLTDRTRTELTASQMEVVSVGAPANCVDPDCERCNRLLGMVMYPEAFMHPMDTKPGDWVLLAPRSLTETDIDGIYCCAQDAVLAILEV